jgi:hypothetical protein
MAEASESRGRFRTRRQALHGMSGTPTYTSWKLMLRRCLNPAADNYPRYGGRGVGVCERWLIFTDFLADMGVRPEGTSLDRHPDPSGHYEPGNCRWGTPRQQASNKRSSLLITHDGVTKILAEWAKERGIPPAALYRRHDYGWTSAQMLGFEPRPDPRKGKRPPAERLLTHEGLIMSLSAWARRGGLTPAMIHARLRKGWSVAEAVGTAPLPTGCSRAHRR